MAKKTKEQLEAERIAEEERLAAVSYDLDVVFKRFAESTVKSKARQREAVDSFDNTKVNFNASCRRPRQRKIAKPPLLRRLHDLKRNAFVCVAKVHARQTTRRTHGGRYS